MPEAKALNITLRPHRSLSGFGLKLVLASVVVSNLVIGIFFWALKAWPVFGFLGLDVALVFWAFAYNNRKAKAHEQIVIEGDEVTFTRASAKGQSKRTFNRRWLRVDLEWDEARELVGRLFLVSHGNRTEIASFLGADERKSLAKLLQSAIIRPKI
jgi:uncharacterized membrane protein